MGVLEMLFALLTWQRPAELHTWQCLEGYVVLHIKSRTLYMLNMVPNI